MSHASWATYQRVESEGVLSKRRFQVYSALWKHELDRAEVGLTHNEISYYVNALYRFPDDYRNNTVARLCELEEQLVVCRTGEMLCPRSKELCTTWMTLDRLPIDLVRKERQRYYIILAENEPYLAFSSKEAAEKVASYRTILEVVATRQRKHT